MHYLLYTGKQLGGVYWVQQDKERGLAKKGRSSSLCKGNSLQAINIFGPREQGNNYGWHFLNTLSSFVLYTCGRLCHLSKPHLGKALPVNPNFIVPFVDSTYSLRILLAPQKSLYSPSKWIFNYTQIIFTITLFSDTEMTIYFFMTQCWCNSPIIAYFLKSVWVPGQHVFLFGNQPFPLFRDIDQTGSIRRFEVPMDFCSFLGAVVFRCLLYCIVIE